MIKKTLYFMQIALSLLAPLILTASSLAETYTTWETMEVDKCASAWLIKRFIDKAAVFKFIPKGDLVKEGIPFDTPDSEFRRYHNMSTYESILKKYQIKDSSLIHIGKIMHDIEVNYWSEKVITESQKIQEEIQEIISSTRDPTECLKKTFPIFDEIYRHIKSESKTANPDYS